MSRTGTPNPTPFKTVVEVGEFNGYPTFKIFEIREDGNKKDVPMISFGFKKAKAIAFHISDIEDFIADHQHKPRS